MKCSGAPHMCAAAYDGDMGTDPHQGLAPVPYARHYKPQLVFLTASLPTQSKELLFCLVDLFPTFCKPFTQFFGSYINPTGVDYAH